jgi:membrane fusion protein (multidrug efflux system)
MRYVAAVLGLLLLIGGLAGVKAKQIGSLMAMGKEMQKAGPPPEAVNTAVVQSQSWEGTLSAVGSVAAAKGVEISNDAPGVVWRINFESGATVRQGQPLVELDSRVERAQLASARARQELADVQAKRSRALVQSNAIAQSTLDTDESSLKTAGADVSGLEAQIDRKTVRAPFAGRLGIRAVNLGQYLNPGTTLTVLEQIDSVFVDFTLPQQQLGSLKVGTPVRATVEGADGSTYSGVVAAIDPSVDSTTRSLKIRATLPNDHEKLRPGMFVNVAVVLPKTDAFVAVPATAIVHASYGDSVFVVEDKKDDSGATVNGPDGKPAKIGRQQFVKLGEQRGDYVAALDGVKPGQELVTAGAFKLHNNSPIMVKNEVNLDAKLSPKPENR